MTPIRHDRRNDVFMIFTVQDFLDLPLMAPARPEVVTGSDLSKRPVRWIHTSEIYEISPLLRGGELLLTTGLGLVGMSAEAIGGYVRAIARQNVAALVLELGRTFTRCPIELQEAAAVHDLPLILLHGVVPFIEVTEAVHPLLISGEIEQLRRLDEAATIFNKSLLAGHGIKHLVGIAGDVCRTRAGLYSPEGALLVGDDVKNGSNFIEVQAGPLAMLAVQAEELPSVRRLAEASALSIAICLSQNSQSSPNRRLAGAHLLRDIAEGRYLSGAEITSRASAIGFEVRNGSRAVGIAVDMTTLTSSRSGLIATAEAARKTFGLCLVAELDGQVLVAASLRGDLRARLVEFAEAVDVELRTTAGGSVARVTAGALVDDAAGLARSIPGAREAAQLARQLALGSRVILATDLGVYHLLAGVVADADLERFVEQQLGPLLEHDARSGSDLIVTLDTYLESGLSKTAAAATLNIRRQTLYHRLDRIAGLLGGFDFGDRQQLTALDLALTTWRMRTSAVKRSASLSSVARAPHG